MRAVIQRVLQAGVTINGIEIARIGRGILVLLGVGSEDSEEDASYLAEKTAYLRIFPDEADKMNRSVLEIEGEVLVVSQFTLYGDCRKGRRPSYASAARPDLAEVLYEFYVAELLKYTPKVYTGRFQAMMEVFLVNDGPVTLLLDSRAVGPPAGIATQTFGGGKKNPE
ncbi:D-tyrosyl-tRNA(Tyr) deacylase [Syntrophobacter sp. SbD1]|nr:D-tyrosyl-tRNA(Tyr) deacylase [Syntrophobacter sp. SbD1]